MKIECPDEVTAGQIFNLSVDADRHNPRLLAFFTGSDDIKLSVHHSGLPATLEARALSTGRHLIEIELVAGTERVGYYVIWVVAR